MKTFFDEPDELVKSRISYREYKKGNDCYCPIKNTYDENEKTIEVESFPFIEKWKVTFKDEVFDVYVNKYHYKTDWVSDVYVPTDRETKALQRILARRRTYTEEYLKQVNESDKFGTLLNFTFIGKIPKKDVNLQEYKELFSGAYWKDDYLYC